MSEEFNCSADNYTNAICGQLESANTTVYQAREMIGFAEQNVIGESKKRGVKPKNTSSNLLKKVIEEYIEKIKKEEVEVEFDVFISKAKYFNQLYSLEYLGKKFDCKGWQVESKIESELRIEPLGDVLWALKKHQSHRIDEARFGDIEIEDTPSGIIYNLVIKEINKRLYRLSDFGRDLYHRASGDPFFKATNEESQALEANLELLSQIIDETDEINALINQIGITKNDFNSLKKFFPKIEFNI